jgi:tol-pal system protein YbgF
MSLRIIAAPALAAVLLVIAGGAIAQESERSLGILDKLFGGSERVAPPGAQERPPSAPAAPSTAQPRVAQSPAGDLMMRIDRLEAQIRQLTGALEQLQYRNQQLEGQLKRVQDDTEYRFQEMRGGAPRAPAPPRPAATPPATPPPATGTVPGRRGDAFDPAQNPAAPGAPRTLGTTTPSPPLPQTFGAAAPVTHARDDDDDDIGAPGGRPAGAPLDLSILAAGAANDATLVPGMAAAAGELPPSPPRNPSATGAQVATLPPSDSPKDSFDLAYGYILRKDYTLAEDGFNGFLRKYPNDRLAPDAQYWLGESLFQRQRFRDAAEAFLNVSTKYDTAAKAPDALLRLGQALAALGEKEAACASFGEVLRKYPRASVGIKQGVDREQKRVRC